MPRYRSETEYFLSRLEPLEAILRTSRFHTASYDVDTANPTRMVVLADSRAQADNLDGYFRIAIDRDGETWGNAPLALGIGRLFTDSGRDRAYAEGTFCSDGLDRLLGDALQAVLGEAYDPGMADFILDRYRAGRSTGISAGGPERTTDRTVASFQWIDVVYVDGFVSYVEFYPNAPVSKA